MLDLPHRNSPARLDNNRLLVLQTPDAVDIDLLWDALIVFTEEFFDIAIVDDDVLSWSEVGPAEFDDALSAPSDDSTSQPIMRGVLTEGRIGIVAPKGRLKPQDWDQLIDVLKMSQDEDDLGVEQDRWQILIDPTKTNSATTMVQTAPETPEKVETLQRTPGTLQKADRRHPIAVSPEQEAFLRMLAAQEDGRHPTIAMKPILLNAPNKAALDATFEALQERHEILHTTFTTFNDRYFIVLDDRAPVPLRHKRVLRPNATLAALAQQKTAYLSNTLGKSGGNWQAVLYKTSTQAALVCVFSKTIADQQTVDYLRAELIGFYEAFWDGRNPEAIVPTPSLQYTDFAASPRDKAKASAWWDQLVPLDLQGQSTTDLPVTAPAKRWRQAIPTPIAERVTSVAQAKGMSPEAVVLKAFLQTMQELEDTPVPWFIMPIHNMRPSEAPNMLGQFTRFCPVWVADLVKDGDVSGLAKRLEDTRDLGAFGLNELSRVMPDRMPARIPYFFEYGQDAGSENVIDQMQDISLKIRPNADSIVAEWAVRLDHPLCKQQQHMNAAFLAQLKRI